MPSKPRQHFLRREGSSLGRGVFAQQIPDCLPLVVGHVSDLHKWGAKPSVGNRYCDFLTGRPASYHRESNAQFPDGFSRSGVKTSLRPGHVENPVSAPSQPRIDQITIGGWIT